MDVKYFVLFFYLKKTLYGLKQAPQAWYANMNSFLLDTMFSRCHSDPNAYTYKVGDHLIILIIYVDDLILIGSDRKYFDDLWQQILLLQYRQTPYNFSLQIR